MFSKRNMDFQYKIYLNYERFSIFIINVGIHKLPSTTAYMVPENMTVQEMMIFPSHGQ